MYSSGMRKSRKKKLRSCGMCKPNKMGYAVRWKLKEYAALRRDEKEVMDAKKVREAD